MLTSVYRGWKHPDVCLSSYLCQKLHYCQKTRVEMMYTLVQWYRIAVFNSMWEVLRLKIKDLLLHALVQRDEERS